jgi:hypothetical protein
MRQREWTQETRRWVTRYLALGAQRTGGNIFSNLPLHERPPEALLNLNMNRVRFISGCQERREVWAQWMT